MSTVPPAHPANPRGPRNGLGTATFLAVVLGALLAVFPATAGFGFLLCLLALVPAVVAFRRARRGVATNRRRSVAAVVMAPAFLAVAVSVGAATAPPPHVQPASDATALGSATHAGPAGPVVPAPQPVLALPAAPAPAADEPAADEPTVDGPATKQAVRQLAPAPPRKATVPPAKAAPAKPAPAKTAPAKPAPTKSAPAAASACEGKTHYVNSSNHCVLRPTATADSSDEPTARCNDGTSSYSEHRSGTCSRHGGVAEWLREVS